MLSSIAAGASSNRDAFHLRKSLLCGCFRVAVVVFHVVSSHLCHIYDNDSPLTRSSPPPAPLLFTFPSPETYRFVLQIIHIKHFFWHLPYFTFPLSATLEIDTAQAHRVEPRTHHTITYFSLSMLLLITDNNIMLKMSFVVFSRARPLSLSLSVSLANSGPHC